MPRKLEFGKGVYIVPFSLVAGVEREVDASDPAVLVVYPDDTQGSELDEIIRATTELASRETV